MHIAYAHELGGTGLASEFTHPLLGLDHLMDEPFLYISALILIALSIMVTGSLWIRKNAISKKSRTEDDKNPESMEIIEN